MPGTQVRPVENSRVAMTSAVHAKAIELSKRVLRMTSAAGSGHPSSALALAHIVVELMYRQMRWDPADPWNPASDRLVLSLGHAVPIVYTAYADLGGVVGKNHAEGQPLRTADLASLREMNSVLEGHPNPAEGFPFFDAATGSLGQGLSVAAGLALAARLDGLDKRVYVIVGDGESREGQVWEAMDFIVDHHLSNVCAIFSCNGAGQAGPVSSQQFPEAVAAKARAFGWDVSEIDGHDPEEIAAALARSGSGSKPLAIVARTIKGWGVPLMQGRNLHGQALPAAELDKALAELDATAKRLGAAAAPVPRPAVPASGRVPRPATKITLPGFEDALKRCGLEAALKKKKMATRAAYGVAMVALGDVDSLAVALDGDVSNSTYANLFAREHASRFFECKIAEQNMVSVGAGLAVAGKIPFASSFAKFLMRGADQIDMAAISRANLKLVGSHSGVSLAADGPSQMALSDVAYFRSMTRAEDGRGRPVCHVFDPADAVSAYRCVELMANIDGLCYLRTHRPEAPFLYPSAEPFQPGGCKLLRAGEHLTVVSCGFMLHTVLAAAEELHGHGVQVNVFDAYTMPLDADPILAAGRATGGVILTVEDNYLGGLHAELAEAAAARGDIRVVGMTPGRIPKSTKTPEEAFAYVGVGLSDIVKAATGLSAGRR